MRRIVQPSWHVSVLHEVSFCIPAARSDFYRLARKLRPRNHSATVAAKLKLWDQTPYLSLLFPSHVQQDSESPQTPLISGPGGYCQSLLVNVYPTANTWLIAEYTPTVRSYRSPAPHPPRAPTCLDVSHHIHGTMQYVAQNTVISISLIQSHI